MVFVYLFYSDLSGLRCNVLLFKCYSLSFIYNDEVMWVVVYFFYFIFGILRSFYRDCRLILVEMIGLECNFE